jgi:hypothetical protein
MTRKISLQMFEPENQVTDMYVLGCISLSSMVSMESHHALVVDMDNSGLRKALRSLMRPTKSLAFRGRLSRELHMIALEI